MSYTKEAITEWVSLKIEDAGMSVIHMGHIAAHFGMSKKTLYRLFRNRDHLTTEALSSILDRVLDEVIEIQNSTLSIKRKIIGIELVVYDTLKNVFPQQWHTLVYVEHTRNDQLYKFFQIQLAQLIKSILEQEKGEHIHIRHLDFKLMADKIIYDLIGILEYGPKAIAIHSLTSLLEHSSGVYLDAFDTAESQHRRERSA